MTRALLVALLIGAIAVGIASCGRRAETKSAAMGGDVLAGNPVAGTAGGPPVDPGSAAPAGVGMAAGVAETAAGAAVAQAPGGGGAPTIAAPPNIKTGMTGKGRALDTIDLGNPTLGGGTGDLKATNDAPREFPRGTTVVTWTVADANGNKATATQRVEIVPDAPLPGGQRH